jgi:hypothetical protein
VVRVTHSQLSLLEQNLARAKGESRPDCGPATAGPARARGRRREDLPENQLERQITDLLAAHGFVTTRQHVGTFVPYRVLKQTARVDRSVIHIGEVGAADWWSARPIIPAGGRALDGPWPWQGFFWEAKASGKRPSAAQLEWLDRRRQVGFEAAWFNQFQAHDRRSPACDPRDSPVFEIWFFGYFDSRSQDAER